MEVGIRLVLWEEARIDAGRTNWMRAIPTGLIRFDAELDIWMDEVRRELQAAEPVSNTDDTFEDAVASIELQLRRVERVDLSDRVLMIGAFIDCENVARVFADPSDGETRIWYQFWQEEIVDCDWAPFVVEVWEVRYTELAINDPDELVEGID